MAIRYYTYKRQVPLKPGDKIGYRKGRGYYRIPAPAPPPPPPPPQRDVHLAQRVVFCAEEPQLAAHAPPNYVRAVSADHAYRYPDLAARIQQLRAGGAPVAGWCDCRPSGGTPAEVGIQFVKDYGLDYFIGQAESAHEFDNAYANGARVMVGNRSALTTDQIAHLRTDVLFIQEDYWNEGWARDTSPDIVAHCAGVYGTPLWPGGPTIASYQQAGRWADGDGIYYARPDTDWGSLH